MDRYVHIGMEDFEYAQLMDAVASLGLEMPSLSRSVGVDNLAADCETEEDISAADYGPQLSEEEIAAICAATPPRPRGGILVPEYEHLGMPRHVGFGTTVDLHRLLADFIAIYAGMKQRGQSWYEAMAYTVGGSEISALMGWNPYSKFRDVVMGKIAKINGDDSFGGDAIACWWGTLFEDVGKLCTEIELGSEVLGDDICIQAIPGHRNSPDGYIVAKFYRDPRFFDQVLWTTDMDPALVSAQRILMLEFKCPFSRKPGLKMPKQYIPQVWSGLAVSPVAQDGLFIDRVFRKCSLDDLDESPTYDTVYHANDRSIWPRGRPAAAEAWGLIGVYAPYMDAPFHVRHGWKGPEWSPGDPSTDRADADASIACWEILTRELGGEPPLAPEPLDLGRMEKAPFERVMSLIDKKRFPIRRALPTYPDSRGNGDTVEETIAALKAAAPPEHWLFAVLPWKLLQTMYAFVERRPGFLDPDGEVMPLIDRVHATVKAAIAAEDPDAYLDEQLGAAKRVIPKGITADDIQDFYDSMPPSKKGSSSVYS